VESSTAPKIILLVEDSFDLQEIFTLILDHAGYCVVVARDGADALDRLQTLRPAAVITDLMMPNMNGVELATALKSNPDLAQIPIALVTATPRQKILEDLGLFARVIQKPCSLDTLLELAELLVSQASSSAADQASTQTLQKPTLA
jgi:CheY-like chemotaxis protein